MRILVVGAGAVGGYFGARLLQGGADVTFLVRAARALQLQKGLKVRSPLGDIDLPAPATVTAAQRMHGFDLVLLSCKAYDLDNAMDDLAPAMDGQCAVLPLLNGMGHMDRLRARFGGQTLLGGACLISATLDACATIIHLSELHQISFGELDGSRSERVEAIERTFAKSSAVSILSDTITQDMWEKWVFIASSAAATCAMRAAIGDIIQADGGYFLSGILHEALAIAAASGHALRPAALARAQQMLSSPHSTMTASMLRDIEHGGRIEADQILGDLLKAAQHAGIESNLLQSAYLHLKSYEQRRAREAASIVSST